MPKKRKQSNRVTKALNSHKQTILIILGFFVTLMAGLLSNSSVFTFEKEGPLPIFITQTFISPQSSTPTTTTPSRVDWTSDCISALWEVYPESNETSKEGGCLQQPVAGSIFTQDGHLALFVDSFAVTPQVYGLFIPLIDKVTIDLEVKLKSLEKAELWTGVFTEPNINSEGLVLEIPPGNVMERPFIILQMPEQSKITTTMHVEPTPHYQMRFELTSGAARAVIIKDGALFATNSYPLSSPQKWLFLGYHVTIGSNHLDAVFVNLTMTPRE